MSSCRLVIVWCAFCRLEVQDAHGLARLTSPFGLQVKHTWGAACHFRGDAKLHYQKLELELPESIEIEQGQRLSSALIGCGASAPPPASTTTPSPYLAPAFTNPYIPHPGGFLAPVTLA